MIYEEHDQVLDFGRWSVLGGIDWLSVVVGLLGGGVVLGMPLALLLGIGARWGLAGGTVLGVVLMLRVGGIAVMLRLALLGRWLLVRHRVLDLGATVPVRTPVRIVRTRDGVPVIKRGQS